jgi:hypothetical protein
MQIRNSDHARAMVLFTRRATIAIRRRQLWVQLGWAILLPSSQSGDDARQTERDVE